MTKLIKRKWLSLMAIAVMVATVFLIGCSSDAVNPTESEGGGDNPGSSGLDIAEWLGKQSWRKYDATIELNGEKVTYSIVFHHQNEVSIYDNYNGNEELNYTWGYSSGHKITFFTSDRFVRFWNNDTIVINLYHMLSRLEKYNGEEKIYMNHSHFYDRQPEEYPNKREEDFYNVALPKNLKLTSEGLLMTYYTYDSKTGAINDNQTALFKIN